LDVHAPRARVERRQLEGHRIRPGIDGPADCPAVPRHDDRHVVPLLRGWTPVAVPRADQWVPFLGDQHACACDDEYGHCADPPHHGTILRCRETDASAPTMPCGERLLSWQMYSNSSVPALHRMMNPPVHAAVYAPGSSIVASYFSELKSVRVKRSARCNCS